MTRLLLILLAVGLALVPTPASWVESVYSRQIYPVVQNLVTPLSSLVRVPVFDLLVLGLMVGLPSWWVVSLRRAGPGRRRRAAGRLTLNTLAVGAGVYVVFLLLWGFNYRRQPLTDKLDFDQRRVTTQALTELTLEAVERLNALHAAAHQQSWPELDQLPAVLGPAFEAVQADLGAVRPAVTGLPKATLLTPYFQRAGVNGMINPLSLEVLVNATVLPFERPFVVAHEWAHLAGYADESEASFVGWLTCLSGGAPSRYSAWLFLTPYLLRHLDRDEQTQMWGRLDEGPTEDFRAVSERVALAVPIVQRNANRVYDRYLRANRVESGIASYGAVVDLVLGSTLGITRR